MTQARNNKTQSPGRWDAKRMVTGLGRVGLTNWSKVDNFAYEMNELIRCCDALPKACRKLKAGLSSTKTDAETLHWRTNDVIGSIVHLRTHANCALRTLRAIMETTQSMPPLGDMSEEEYGVYVVNRMFAKMHRLTKGAFPASVEAAKAAERQERAGKRAAAKKKRRKSKPSKQ